MSFLPKEQRERVDLSDPTSIARLVKEHLAASKPVTSEEYLEQLKSEKVKLDADGGLTVEPRKEFVMKSLEQGSGGKVFINVTSHPIVEEPHQTALVGEQAR